MADANYNIVVDTEELDEIVSELKSLYSDMDDPISVLDTILKDRKDEIWCGKNADEYWRIVQNQKKNMEVCKNKLAVLGKTISAYSTAFKETEAGISSELSKLK